MKIRFLIAALALCLSGIPELSQAQINGPGKRKIPSQKTVLVECNIGTSRSLFEVDNENSTVKDAQSDVQFKIIFFKEGILKFSSDNPFFAMDFAAEGEFPDEVIITIDRVTGASGSQVFFKDRDRSDVTNPKNIRYGKCRPVNSQF